MAAVVCVFPCWGHLCAPISDSYAIVGNHCQNSQIGIHMLLLLLFFWSHFSAYVHIAPSFSVSTSNPCKKKTNKKTPATTAISVNGKTRKPIYCSLMENPQFIFYSILFTFYLSFALIVMLFFFYTCSLHFNLICTFIHTGTGYLSLTKMNVNH